MVFDILRRVFEQPRYTAAALLAAVVLFSTIVLLPHLALIETVFRSEADLMAKGELVLSLYASLLTKYHLWGALNILLTSVLFGVNIALVIYYIRRRQQIGQRPIDIHLAGIGGLVSSMLGIGCAACGSVVVTAVLGLFGASGLILLLPFHGAEFGVLGLLFLCLSIYYVCRRIADPLVCPLSTKDLRSSSV